MGTTRIKELMKVKGSDGNEVGIVEFLRGNEIILRKSDFKFNSQKHSIPLDWVDTIDQNVIRLNKLSEEAQAEWAEVGGL